MTLPTAFPSSTATNHRTHTVLINQYSRGMGAIGCSSTHLLVQLLPIYGSVFVSSFLRPPPSVHVNLRWGNLSLISFHAAVCCQARDSFVVPGATLLGMVLIWYVVNRLLITANLARQAASVLRLCLGLPFSLFLFFFFFSLLLSRRLPPRTHITLPWGHLSMAGGLAEGN